MIVTSKTTARPGRARALRWLLSRWSERAIATVLEWTERHRQRRALVHLSESMLKDIGLSRGDVDHEATKPFWRP